MSDFATMNRLLAEIAARYDMPAPEYGDPQTTVLHKILALVSKLDLLVFLSEYPKNTP